MNTRATPRNPAAAETVAGAKRGRPLDPAKHARILAAATEEFLQHGFDGTSMDRVAHRATVSKVTVYTHFRSKEALFAVIVDGLAGGLVRSIEELAVAEMHPGPALRLFGRRYLALALAPSSLALHRMVVAEAARIPALGPAIFASGPAQVVDGLASFLSRSKALRLSNPRLAAEQFLGMVLGHSQLRLLLNADPGTDTRRDIAAIVDHAVELFLNGALSTDSA